MLLASAVVLNVYLIIIAPRGFPGQDTGGIMGGVRVDQSISFDKLQDKLTRVANIVKDDPAVSAVIAVSGGRPGGSFFITLVRSQRPQHQSLLPVFVPNWEGRSGYWCFSQPDQDLRVGGQSNYQHLSVCPEGR
ncbi:MAG: efflux RND transporter permease subunit [Nitrosomonas sp.]|nr:efflux RND transporter permease subunit [Nitrosomonas sp.]